MKNKNKQTQNTDFQNKGIQSEGKSSESGMRSGGKVNLPGQGSVAGSTGTGNQGKTGNPVSGKK
jgi:hypothetical protein